MAGNYLRTMFGDAARALQEADGSRASYARMEQASEGPDQLGEAEAAFIVARDSCYIASVTADSWPYLQHRGGPPGFLKVLERNRIGFADYRGNRQHISTANFVGNSNVSLFLIDYAAKQRLKLIGHASVIPRADDPVLVESLKPSGYTAVVERAYLIDIVGFDWNCPQHITPRYAEAEIKAGLAPLLAELSQLKTELAELKGELN
jgi:uncharacterized protein